MAIFGLVGTGGFGRGAVVGMGAVVTKDVAPYEVVGNPAKPLNK